MNKDKIKILLVDDDEDDYIVTKELLAEVEEREYELEWASSYKDALELIGSKQYDVFLFDYNLGAHSGLDLLREVINHDCTSPVVMLTGQGNNETDIEAMNAGAVDYLSKSEINSYLLDRSVRYAIKNKKAEDRILHMAYYDSLTNLPNRALFNDRLKQALAHGERNSSNLAVLFLDLDNFKRINDTFEHRAGDLLLQGISDRIIKCLRTSDTVSRPFQNSISNTVARLGGDEFTILLSEIESAESAAKVAQRVLTSITYPFLIEGHEVYISGSIGIAIYPLDGEDADHLLRNADTAMYHAKEQGKNNFQFYKQSMNASAFERLMMENSLRKAIEHQELLLYYQPRMELSTNRVVSTEALIRWQHPELGLFPPGKFIPLAEDTGLIIPIGEWVLNTACKQNWTWQQGGKSDTHMAVSLNISGEQFKHSSLIQVVEKVLHDSGLPPASLELEITETVIMKDAESTIKMLEKLKSMGVQLSMDDFGTGYSSFNYLKKFPLDIVKIDRSFVQDVTKNKEDATIVKAMIAMAHSLNLRVVAEGVETGEQLQFLRENGCDEMQGYLLSPPVPVDEVTNFFLHEIDLEETVHSGSNGRNGTKKK
jgi:diguanylate cyclase (GGDEF)-like protein